MLSHLADSLERIEDTAPMFDLFVLLGRLFMGDSRRKGSK